MCPPNVFSYFKTFQLNFVKSLSVLKPAAICPGLFPKLCDNENIIPRQISGFVRLTKFLSRESF